MSQDAPETPQAEVDIDAALIRALLTEQHPDFANLPIEIVEAGWDNVMVRLGDELAVRLPRRAAAVPLLLNEQRWLSELAPRLPLPIPAPVRIGVPGCGYPWNWSVLPWLPGAAADLAPPDASEALVLANFLKALHVPAPEDAPSNSHRDCPLADKAPNTEMWLADIRRVSDVVTPTVEALWRDGVAAPIDVPQTWIAGDVHARNVLVENGKLAAFIDWGDMCAGDRASDLASIWALFEDPAARRAAIEAYGMSDATLTRAKGWAVFYGAILMATGLKDTPRHAVMGEATLRRLHADGV